MTNQTILVVDDTASILKLTKEIFEIAGYNVITAADGALALEILTKGKIDLVITDILMPNVDGYILCYSIRTTEKIKDIPVIIYSATYTSSSDETMAMEIGADQFIRKPALMNDLIGAAQHLLSRERNYSHKIPEKPKSLEATHLYNEGLVNKLERRNIELEQATKRLEQSEARLKEAQMIAHIGHWQVALADGSTIWSDEIYRIYGTTREETPPTIESFLSFMHPDDLEFTSEKIKHTLAFGTNESFTYRFIRKDGALRHGYTEWRFEFDKGNVPLRLYGISQDITEKKEQEEKLKTSELRFRALIENSTDAIVLSDENSNILYQSPSVVRILGYSQEERIGKPVLNYVHPDDRNEFVTLYENLKKSDGQPLGFQYRFRRKNGDFIWLEGVVANLLNDPSVRAFVANYRDITARKEAQDLLELTLSRFEQAQHIAHLGHWEQDFATQHTSWSDETFRILGLEPNSIEPSEEAFLKFIYPEDIEMVGKEIAYAKQMLTPFSIYHRIALHNESIRTLLTVGRYEFDKSGNPLRLYGISLDVSELAEKEKKLKEVNKDLATFIYKSSHDLRTPIASIIGLINVAKTDIKDATALNYLEMIYEVVQRQNKMLLNLTQVMSIRDSKVVVESLELRTLVEEVLLSLKSMKGFTKIKFTILDLETNLLQTDRELMIIILSQLIENSIVYAGPREPETKIRSSNDKKGNTILEVTDNGVGIPAQSSDKVFDMFYRGSVLSRGSGLGLYLVKTAVEKMGGTIKVSSEEQKGTAFVIRFPIKFSADRHRA